MRVEYYIIMDFDTLPREELIRLLKSALETIEKLQGQIVSLQKTVAELQEEIKPRDGGPPTPDGKKPTVPDFVKPNAKQTPAKPRKKRPHGFSRKRLEPNETYECAPESCSCCGRNLTGGWKHAVREIIELPTEPVRIIHYNIMARHCGVCGRREVASPDFSDQVVGKGRLGVRLVSTIAYLDAVCRMTIENIKNLLAAFYGLSISEGEIVEVLHMVARRGEPVYKTLECGIQTSPVVHADETGWREKGQNGYFWSFSTPEVRYYVGQERRCSEVPKRVLGSTFDGVLVTDFYSSYHWYMGPHPVRVGCICSVIFINCTRTIPKTVCSPIFSLK